MNRAFYALLTSQTSTNLGFALYTMVIVLHLYNETGSTTLSATVTLISMLSRMVSGIVLPAISDRFEPPKLLMFSQLAQLVLLFGLFFLFLQIMSTVIMILLFILIAFMSFFNGFFTPIKSTIVKAIVSENDRVRANSLIVSVDQTFLFAGWTFGGLLLAFLGIQTTFIVTFSLLLISIACLFFIKINKISDIVTQDRLINRLTTGWKYLFKHEGLRILILMDLIESWVGTIWIGAVTLTFVKEALGKGETWWGYINGFYYLGTIVGGILVYRLSKYMKGRLTLFMLSGAVLFGLLTLFYGMVTNGYIALILVLLMGPAYQIRDLAQETMLQNCTDEHILTKILATKSTIVHLISIFSILVIGALTDLIGVRFVYIFSGCLLIFSSLFGYYFLIFRGRGLSLETDHVSNVRIAE